MTFWSFTKHQLKKTLVTGIPQIMQAQGLVRKLIKTIVFLFCLFACLYQICGYMRVYYSYPVVVDIFVSSPATVREPAITICPHHGLKAGRYCGFFRNENCAKTVEDYRAFCNVALPYCNYHAVNKLNKSFLPMVRPEQLKTVPDMAPELVRNIYKIMGGGTGFIVSAYSGRDGIEPTHVGAFNVQGLPVNCHAFNVLWGDNETEVKNVTLDHTYQFRLITDREELFYNTIPDAIQVEVHDPLSQVNPFKSGFSLTACKMYNIYIYKTEKFLLPAPYPTNCTDYLEIWKGRGGYGPLNQRECIDECLLNMSIAEHGCFNPRYIAFPNNKPFCFNETAKPRSDSEAFCRDQCPNACFDQSFDTKIEESATNLPPPDGGCITYLSFYLTRLNLMTFTYKQKYESVEVFGYVGGYLGMWLGFSLIAAFDFLEMIFSLVFYSCRAPSKENFKKKMVIPIDQYDSSK